MAKDKNRTPEAAALLLERANPSNPSTLRLLLRSGLAKHPTKRMIQRHIHPRRMRGLVK